MPSQGIGGAEKRDFTLGPPSHVCKNGGRGERGRHGHFLNSTCDIGLGDMRQGLKIIAGCDIAYS